MNTYSSYIPPTCPTPGSDPAKTYSPASTTIPGSPAGPTRTDKSHTAGLPFPTPTDPSAGDSLNNGSKTPHHDGPIAGIVLGTIAGLTLIGASFWLWLRRKDRGSGGGREWYRWEPGTPSGLTESPVNVQAQMDQLGHNGASLPQSNPNNAPAYYSQGVGRGSAPPFSRRGTSWSFIPFGRQHHQSRITPYSVTRNDGQTRQPRLEKISTGFHTGISPISPETFTASETTSVEDGGHGITFSPNSRHSDNGDYGGHAATSITIPHAPRRTHSQPLLRSRSAPNTTNTTSNPSPNTPNSSPHTSGPTGSGSTEPSSTHPTSQIQAQLHALAREVSLLRSDRGNMNQGHSGGLELPPVYEDHHEDEVLSSSTRVP